MGNHQLHGFLATKLVNVELVGQFHPANGRVGPDLAVDAEGDAIELHRTALALEHHFQMRSVCLLCPTKKEHSKYDMALS